MTKSLMTPSNRTALCTAKISALSLAMLLMQSNMAFAAPTTLVQTINNIANASYDVNSIKQNSISNQVQVKASALPEYGINLTQQPLRSTVARTVAPNTLVNWVNVLSNTSYSSQTVELTLQPTSVTNVKVYQDLNKNGIIDSGDTQLILDNMSAQIKLGQSENIQFIVQALSDANGKDGDTADIKIGAIVLEDPSVSKEVIDGLIIVESKIDFFEDDTYQKFQSSTQVGKDVYLQTSFAQCNLSATQQDYVWVTFSSAKTGDSLLLKALEIEQEGSYNTGKYQVLAPTQNNATKISADGIIQTSDGDTLTATNIYCTNQLDLKISAPELSTTIEMISPAGLIIEKTSEVRTAELGDYVNYTINIRNNGNSTAYNVELKDALPRGFDYVAGSLRVDGAKTNDFKAEGKYQVLGLGDLTSGTSKNITYRVLIGSTALGGDGINRAIAQGKDSETDGKTLTSLEAHWPIEIERGVINTDGIIVGKVYHDINRDGIQQKEDGELGVAGVRIYMENGNFVVTDPEGKYNFYGVSAKTHVLKVDRTTIPNATELVTQSNRNAGDAGSRFVDLKYGELHRADFAIVGGMGDSTERLNAELVARSKSVSAKNDSLEQAVKTELVLEPDYNRDNKDNVDASGCKSNDVLDAGIQCDSAIVNEMVKPAANHVDMTVTTIAPPVEKELEEYLKDVSSNDVAFINLSEGQQLSTYKQMVQVQAPLGSIFTLYANGKAVSEQQIGKTAEQEKQKVTAFDYYAVDLKRGTNTLRGVATDVNNKTISEQTIEVLTPDSLQAINYRTQEQLVPADGVSEYQVVISLRS